MEDDRPCRSFFLEPVATFHRHYEALRAFFVEERSLTEIAKEFGYRHSSLRSMVSRFRAQLQAGEAPPFFQNRSEDEPSARVAYKNRPARRHRRSPTVDS
jgi:hypothetical protein